LVILLCVYLLGYFSLLVMTLFLKTLKLAYNTKNVMMMMIIQGGSNMTGTDLYVNKPHCAAAVRP